MSEPWRQVSGRRLLAGLGLWALIGAVSLGLTLALLRLGAPAWTRAHAAAAGAILVLEAYAALLTALLFAFEGGAGLRQRLGFRFTSIADLAGALGVWLVALVAGVLLTELLAPLLTPLTGPPRSNAVQLLRLSFDPLFVVLIVPTVCLLAPACEELLFRGAIFGWLRSRLPVAPAAALSAGLFAGAHLLPALFAELFLFGLAAAWVYQRTGSTLNSFAMHASQNTLAVVAAYAVLRSSG